MTETDEYLKRIGIKIKQHRLYKDMTMKELGQKIGVSESAISKYESGKIREISINTIKKIANVLSCPAEVLMDWNTDAPSEWISDNNYIIEKLSNDNKDHLAEYAKFLLSQQKDK